jgi:hypothetical protein
MNQPDGQAMLPLSRDLIAAITRASARSASVTHEQMKAGLEALATIASIAPWLGLFGTLVAIATSFLACGGESSMCMAAFADRLSGSIWPTAMGLLVGLISLWCYKYLTGKLETCDREMQSASLDLLDQLRRYSGRWNLSIAIQPTESPSMFGAISFVDLRREQTFWTRSMFMTGAGLFGAWCLQIVRYFEQDYLPLSSAIWAAFLSALFVFCVSCVPGYILWVIVLRRRRGGLVAAASVLGLSWSVAKLIWHVRFL